MHARPLPHILEVAFNVVCGDFGVGRTGTFSLPSQYFGVGGTGTPPHMLGDFSPFLKRDLDHSAVGAGGVHPALKV